MGRPLTDWRLTRFAERLGERAAAMRLAAVEMNPMAVALTELMASTLDEVAEQVLQAVVDQPQEGEIE